MHKRTKFVLAIALQTAIIACIIVFKLYVLSSGIEVLLKIEPVDPRDLLRGDYAVFQYSISNLEPHLAGGQQIRNGDTVYVVLVQAGKYWAARNIQKNKPEGSELFIRGKVESGGLESQTGTLLSQSFGGSRLHVVYGIEQFFIPEGKGRNFSFRNKETTARVSIDNNGDAVLKQIYVDDKPWP